MANAFSLSTQGASPFVLPKQNAALTSGIKTAPSATPNVTTNTSGLVGAGNANSGLATSKPITSGFLPTTPVKSVTSADGTKTEFHLTPEVGVSSPSVLKSAGMMPSASKSTAQSPSAKGGTGAPAATPPPANGLTGTQVAQGYSTIPGQFNPVNGQSNTPAANPNVTPADNGHNQPITRQGAANAVQQAGQVTPLENQFLNQTVQAQQLSNINSLSPYAESAFYGGGGQQVAPDLAAPDLEGRSAGTSALANKLGNIFGSASAAGLQSATNIANRGLTSAGDVLSATNPILGQYGQNNYNSIGGGSAGGNIQLSGQPASDVSNLTSSVANGQVDYSTAYSQLSSAYGAAVANQLLPAIQKSNPSFNVNASIGQGSASQSNAQTTGTIGTSTAASGYSSALQNYNQTSTFNSTAQQQGQQVQQILASTGLNNSASNDYTKAINSLSGRLGSTAVTQLNTAMRELQNSYSQLLSAGGGTPSGQEAAALATLDPNSSAAQINASLQTLEQAAYAKLNSQYQLAQTYYGNLNQGSQKSAGSSASGSGLYSF